METNTLNITQGKWELNCNPFSCTITVKENHGWKVIATCTDDSGLVKEMQANAQAIASLPTLLKEHGELKDDLKTAMGILKGVKFMFGNEANYPPNTRGYLIAEEITNLQNKITNL